jgi:hypothetical protein
MKRTVTFCLSKKSSIFILFVWLFISAGMHVMAQSAIWSDVKASEMRGSGKQYIIPGKFRPLSFDMAALKTYLSNAPMEAENGSYDQTFYFTFPMPDGSDQKFYIVESPVMAAELGNQYPGIRTFTGQGIDDPTATVRFDYTQLGFHAMILSNTGSYFIDPYFWMESVYYISYDKMDYYPRYELPSCLTGKDEPIDRSFDFQEMPSRHAMNTGPVVNKSSGTQLRKYDLALACTGEYSITYGSSVANSLAGMVTSVNRVDGIYEREIDVRMVLIPNTNLLIYLNPGTDPYTNFDGNTMLAENQTNITQIIGSFGYDIGHVFSTGGGGIAYLGSVCVFAHKAKGVTGLPNPIGDPFDVDFVAHEMGHQFGGNHTFNCETGYCAGNRATNAAYESGSGTTIMAYAGTCGSMNDLQPHSDPFFHTKSFDEITIFSQTGAGNGCATITATGNTPPVITSIGPDFIIPISTPFKLTGVAYDPDAGDTITYCWEEYDLGPPCNWNAPFLNAPLFRSWPPTLSPTRLFPKLSSILTNTQNVKGEYKPDYARNMTFKLTVRDNKMGGGGVTNSDTLVNIQVINTGTPFAITAPNTTGIVYDAMTLQTITWDVSSTDVAPINTPAVNIYLSTDGGQTFPIPLGYNVPNNGSFQWWVPMIATTQARVWVEGNGNAFFDINDNDFTLTGTVGIGENELSPAISVYPNPGNDLFNFAVDSRNTGNVHVRVMDQTGRTVLDDNLYKSGQQLVSMLDLHNYDKGIYLVEFTFNEGRAVRRIVKM